MSTRETGKAVLLVACVSTLVVNANTSAVSILLPSISRDTGTSIDTLQFAVTGYSMVGAAVIVTSGVLGDIFGRRKVFLLGLALSRSNGRRRRRRSAVRRTARPTQLRERLCRAHTADRLVRPVLADPSRCSRRCRGWRPEPSSSCGVRRT
jgi:hypothetical protein